MKYQQCVQCIAANNDIINDADNEIITKFAVNGKLIMNHQHCSELLWLKLPKPVIVQSGLEQKLSI